MVNRVVAIWSIYMISVTSCSYEATACTVDDLVAVSLNKLVTHASSSQCMARVISDVCVSAL